VLGELECAALERHLERCSSCARTRSEIAAFTLLLRAAPLAERRLPVSVPPRRPARARRVRRAAAGLVLAAALAAGATLFVLPQGAPVASSAALSLATPRQRLEFAAAERDRTEPPTFAPASAPERFLPYAARALA